MLKKYLLWDFEIPSRVSVTGINIQSRDESDGEQEVSANSNKWVCSRTPCI